MKYLEKKDNKLILLLEPIETSMVKSVFFNSCIIDGPSKATKEELSEIREYLTGKPIREALNEKQSTISLTGRQLLLVRDTIAESLREIPTYEFDLRHPGTEQEAADLLFEIKRIQDETKDYGIIP